MKEHNTVISQASVIMYCEMTKEDTASVQWIKVSEFRAPMGLGGTTVQ